MCLFLCISRAYLDKVKTQDIAQQRRIIMNAVHSSLIDELLVLLQYIFLNIRQDHKVLHRYTYDKDGSTSSQAWLIVKHIQTQFKMTPKSSYKHKLIVAWRSVILSIWSTSHAQRCNGFIHAVLDSIKPQLPPEWSPVIMQRTELHMFERLFGILDKSSVKLDIKRTVPYIIAHAAYLAYCITVAAAHYHWEMQGMYGNALFWSNQLIKDLILFAAGVWKDAFLSYCRSCKFVDFDLITNQRQLGIDILECGMFMTFVNNDRTRFKNQATFIESICPLRMLYMDKYVNRIKSPKWASGPEFQSLLWIGSDTQNKTSYVCDGFNEHACMLIIAVFDQHRYLINQEYNNATFRDMIDFKSGASKQSNIEQGIKQIFKNHLHWSNTLTKNQSAAINKTLSNIDTIQLKGKPNNKCVNYSEFCNGLPETRMSRKIS